jgi:hypothetical protein
LFLGDFFMSVSGGEAANGKSRRVTGRKPEFRFINHDLSAAQADELEALDLEAEFTIQDVLLAAQDGYSFMVAPDARGGGFRAHLIDEREGSEHAQRCLSGRGSTPLNAVAALFYRHVVLAQEDWSFFADDARSTPKFG